MMRTLKRSSSLLSSGITASATLRPISCEESSPARSMMSSSGASPATVGSAMPPRSICPARSTRKQLGPGEVALRPARERHRDAPARALRQLLAQHRDVDAGVLRDGRRELRHHGDRDRRPGGSSCAKRGVDSSASAAPRSMRFMSSPISGPGRASVEKPCHMAESGISGFGGKGAGVVARRRRYKGKTPPGRGLQTNGSFECAKLRRILLNSVEVFLRHSSERNTEKLNQTRLSTAA